MITRYINAACLLSLAALPLPASAQGAETFGSTPAQFAKHIRDEYVRFGKAVKDAGVRVE